MNGRYGLGFDMAGSYPIAAALQAVALIARYLVEKLGYLARDNVAVLLHDGGEPFIKWPESVCSGPCSERDAGSLRCPEVMLLQVE